MSAGHASTGYVKQGEFAYFIYESICKNCTLTISLSSYSNGNPDLYVVKSTYNETRLPSLTDYDFKKATLTSEVLTLNQNSTKTNG